MIMELVMKAWAVINPFDKTCGWIAPHALLAAILLTIGFVSGFILGPTGIKHDIAFFRTHYGANLPNPTTKSAVAFKAGTTSNAATVNIAVYPAVGNQGPLGECAAWGTAWYLAYDWRTTHPGSWLRFSPRQMYDHYSNTYANGQDAGSWPDQDAEISSTTGLLQFKALPEPPFVIDHPIPQYDNWGHLTSVDAAKHKFYAQFTQISGFSAGGGPGLSQSVMQQIDGGKPVIIAFPVYPEYDNATAQPTILNPTSGESSRGDHLNVVLAYDKYHLYPDGHRGLAFLIQNQWTTAWGINGRAWMSDEFMQKYVWGVETVKIVPQAVKLAKLPPWFPPHGSARPAPKTPPSVKAPRSGYWYVRGVVTHDTHVDVSRLMNYWGDKYGVPPIGLAATAGIESSVNQYADRCCIPGDTSYGIVQETTGTTCSYVHICTNDGARAYLNNPGNAIQLEARYYQDAFSFHGNRIGFPQGYGMYNCGPGYSDWFYENLNVTGACHFQPFLGWWNYAISVYAGPAPPAPKFPAKTWGWFRWRHHLAPVSHGSQGRIAHGADLWWSYGPHKAGAVVSPERYAVPHRGRGYMTQRFQYRRLYWWPKTNWWKMIPVRPIR